MTVARSVARAVASPVARAVVPGDSGSGTDADAAAYFATVEGAGGSFDLSGINAAYTETAVKAAHNTLVLALKSANVWSKLIEYYLFAGKTWPGVTRKLKGSGTLGNVAFVIGDYVAAGSGAGLKGNGSTKYLTTALTPADSENISFGGYITGLNTLSGRYYFGHGAAPNGQAIGSETVAGQWRFYDGAGVNVAAHQVGSAAFTRRSSSDAEAYSRGASVWTSAGAGTTAEGEFRVFGFGTGGLFTDGRLATTWRGTGITDADAAAIASAEQAFMTALGGNAY